jgi:ATP-dependent DNA ligase
MNLQNGCRISRNRLEGGDTPWLAQNVSATSATYPNRANERIFLYAFDLIELSGDDLWRDPLEGRKATLEMMLSKVGPGIGFNEHIEADGQTVFKYACELGLESIVSKRKDTPYRSGRSPDWLKFKNPVAPAVKREAEEEWEEQRHY